MKKIRTACILVLVLAMLLPAAGCGGTSTGSVDPTPPSLQTSGAPVASASPVLETEMHATTAAPTADSPMPTPVMTVHPTPSAQPEPTVHPISSAPPEAAPSATLQPEAEKEALTCSLWVRCDTILDNMDKLDKDKTSLVPEDGVLLHQEDIPFTEGETVFNLLLRVTRENKVHLEFVNTPGYQSAYIEGIGNLYEFDCGELSGWSYKVNGAFPGYGCSLYELSSGDMVEWLYTCDLGRDIGGSNEWEAGT